MPAPYKTRARRHAGLLFFRHTYNCAYKRRCPAIRPRSVIHRATTRLPPFNSPALRRNCCDAAMRKRWPYIAEALQHPFRHESAFRTLNCLLSRPTRPALIIRTHGAVFKRGPYATQHQVTKANRDSEPHSRMAS